MIESNHVQEEDENRSLLSKSKLDVEEVVESNHIQEDEEKSSLPSNFDLEIKDVSDATTLVVEETVTMLLKETLTVTMEPFPILRALLYFVLFQPDRENAHELGRLRSKPG